MPLDPSEASLGPPRLHTGCANEHSHKPSKGPCYRADCLRAKGEGSNTRGRATFRALSPPDHASPTCRTGVRKSLQVWPCKAELCVSPVAFPLTALVRAGRTRGELDLPARRQHDERRGAVSILVIPLSLGCPVPLPPCPSACGTESGESSLVIGSGCPRLPPAGGALGMEPQVRRLCLLRTAPSSVARPPSAASSSPACPCASLCRLLALNLPSRALC